MAANTNINKSRKHTSFVGIGVFDRAVSALRVKPGPGKERKYVPLPKTHSWIVSRCVFSLNEFAEAEVTFNQFDKTVLDAIYTAYHDDVFRQQNSLNVETFEEEQDVIFRYSLADIAAHVYKKQGRLASGLLKQVSDSILRLAQIEVELDCEQEMMARDKAMMYNGRVPLIDAVLKLSASGKVRSISLKSEPVFHWYDVAIGHFVAVDDSTFTIPAEMKVTVRRVMMATYLRDRILSMMRSPNTTRIISFASIYRLVDAGLSRAEEKVVREEACAMLNHFAKQTSIFAEDPYSVMTGDHNKITGFYLNLVSDRKKEAQEPEEDALDSVDFSVEFDEPEVF